MLNVIALRTYVKTIFLTAEDAEDAEKVERVERTD